MKVKRKIERRRLIAQAPRNPDNSTTDDSDLEMITPDVRQIKLWLKQHLLQQLLKPLYIKRNENSEEPCQQMHLKIRDC